MSSPDNKSIYKDRIATCRECPHFAKFTRTCRKCGCVVLFKAALKNEECPDGRWFNVDRDSDQDDGS